MVSCSFSLPRQVQGTPGSISLSQLQWEGQTSLPFAQQRLCNDSLQTKTLQWLFTSPGPLPPTTVGGGPQHDSPCTYGEGNWWPKWFPFWRAKRLFSASWHFPSFHPNENIFVLSNWKQKSGQGNQVNSFSLKRSPFDKIFAWRRLRWKTSWTWRMKVVSKLTSRLHFIQTQYCSVYKPTFSLFFVGKAFYCRLQFWLIGWKNSQDHLAGLCLIKLKRRLNKWTNQERTYVRAPCPGLWELGAFTLPKPTVSLCHLSRIERLSQKKWTWRLAVWLLEVIPHCTTPIGVHRTWPSAWTLRCTRAPSMAENPQSALCLEGGGGLCKP